MYIVELTDTAAILWILTSGLAAFGKPEHGVEGRVVVEAWRDSRLGELVEGGPHRVRKELSPSAKGRTLELMEKQMYDQGK